MKKLLFIIILFSLQGYAQKKLEIYNNTSFPFDIYDIATNASGNFPEFRSKGTTVSILPGGMYTLVNTSDIYRFPFFSPSSSPIISSWVRVNPPNPSAIMPSIAAWSLGNPQVFSSMAFGVPPGTNAFIISTTVPVITGPASAWTAVYSMFVNPLNPNDITYTIVIN